MIWNQVVKFAFLAALATSVWSIPTANRVAKRESQKYVFAHFMVNPLAYRN